MINWIKNWFLDEPYFNPKRTFNSAETANVFKYRKMRIFENSELCLRIFDNLFEKLFFEGSETKKKFWRFAELVAFSENFMAPLLRRFCLLSGID